MRRVSRRVLASRPSAAPGLVPALVLAGYLALAFSWTARIWLAPAGRQPPNPPDVALFTWFLTWAAHPSWTLHADQLNVPDGVNVMWQTSMVLPGVLLGPLTRAAGAQVTYNLLLTLGPALSAWSAFLVLRRLLARDGPGRVAGPVLGGLLYGFGPATGAEVYGGHLQFAVAVLPPVLLLLGVEALLGRRRPLRTGLLLGVLLAAALLTGTELLAMTALVGGGVAVALRPPWSRVLRLAAGTAATAVPLTAWPLLVLLVGPGRATGNIQLTGHFQEDLAGLVVPTRLLVLSVGSALTDRFPTGVQERTSYLGIPLLALVAFLTVRHWADRRVRLLALTAGVLSVLSLGADLRVAGLRTYLPLPWAALERSPVLGNILPSRFPLLVALAVGGLLALAGELHGRRGLLLAALALVPLVPARLPAVPVVPTPLFFAARPTGTLLVLPFPTPRSVRAMRWQGAAQLSFAMPGGFFVGPDQRGRARFGPVLPPSAALLVRAESGQAVHVGAGERAAFRADLARWGVRAVVLGPAAHGARLAHTVTALVGRPPQRQGGVDLWPLRSPR